MYVSLYRRYRPQSFSEMVGQNAAVDVLRESLKEGRLGHAYLFSGPRGCGKTSAARLVAKTLNCSSPTEAGESCGLCSSCVSIAMGEHLDVIEIDGASNRGIEAIRDLKSHINLKPLSSKFKIYIIDEVHMLTEPAFNALLKTLEEPPANVVFLLATTEPHKVPVTIRSRCQHIPFHRIAIADMVSRIIYITEQEGVTAEPEAIWEISRQADGALRDALSLLEQAVTLGKGQLTLDSVSCLMGGSNRTELEKWAVKLRTEPALAAADLEKILGRGISVERLTESLFVIFRDILLYSLWGERSVEAVENSESERAFLKEESVNWDAVKTKEICAFLCRLLPRTRYGMRLEVFSGVVMTELLAILEGNAEPQKARPVSNYPSSRQVSRPVVPISRARQSSAAEPTKAAAEAPELPMWDDDFSDLAEESQQTAGQRTPLSGAQECAAAVEINYAEALGDNDFARLLTAIESKALVFGAALLHAELAEKNGDWKLDFTEKLSPAESFLNSPQNKRVLSDAVYKVWGVGVAPKKETTGEPSALFQNGPPLVVQTRTTGKAEREKTRGANPAAPASGSADAEQMAKLMGAELLYARNLQDDENAEEKSV